MPQPHLILLAGPNGAGKSTAAPALLRGALGVTEFVNADTLAQGLSVFDPQRMAVPAARIMLARLRELADARADFAFETTLASRTFVPWIAGLQKDGYAFHLVFLWLPNAEMAVARVRERVRLGGHDVPEETIRRRFARGLRNFFRIYQPLATTWRFYDNGEHSGPRLIVLGGIGIPARVRDTITWREIQETWDDAPEK